MDEAFEVSSLRSDRSNKILLPLVLVSLLSATLNTLAGNHYVRKAADGSNDGTDWINAWSEMNQINLAALACGDTVWIAGGTYSSGLQVNASCAAGSVLTFNRVLSTDAIPSAAPGWKSSFDSLVTLTNIDIPGPSSYLTVSGRSPYGIKVLIPGTSGDGIDGGEGKRSGKSQPIDHITFSNIEIYGAVCVSSGTCTESGIVGVNIMPYCEGANRTNLLFDHLSIHRIGEAFRGCGWDNAVIQYSLIYDTHNDGQQHEDVLYSNPPYQNVTWRYNRIFQSPNDGLFFEGNRGAVNLAFYGNLVYHSGGWLICFKAAAGDTFGPVHIYNNTFENDSWFDDHQPAWLGFSRMVSGSEVANNIFENVISSAEDKPPNANHNAYSLADSSDGGSGSFSYHLSTLGVNSLFQNKSPLDPIAADFHLTLLGASIFAAGKVLPAPYNVDADGHPRGAGGSWSIGAYQSMGISPAGPKHVKSIIRLGIISGSTDTVFEPPVPLP